MKNLRFVAYYRKSSEDEERQVQSLEGQKEVVRELAKSKELNICEEISESMSAHHYGRKGFGKLTKLIEDGKVDAIICWKMDRLARNMIDGGFIIESLKQCKVKAIITQGKNFYPSENAIVLSMEFGMADQYSRDLSVGVKRGLNQKCHKGWRPGVAPIGYLNNTADLKGDRTIISDDQRFHFVKKIWRMFVYDKMPVSKILKIAREKWHLTTPARKKSGGKLISSSAIYRILNDCFYYGDFKYNGVIYEGRHEAMITKKEFEIAQERLKSKYKKRIPENKAQSFKYSGLIRCGECNCSIVGEEKRKKLKSGKIKKYHYYHCSWRKADYKCSQKSIQKDILENQIIKKLEKITIPDKYLAIALLDLEKHRQQEKRERVQLYKTLEGQYKKEVDNHERLMDCYFSGDNENNAMLSKNEFIERKAKIEQKKDTLKKQLDNFDKFQNERADFTVKTFEFCKRLKILFQESSPEKRQAILRTLGSNFSLTDKELVVELKKPFMIIEDGLEDLRGLAKPFEPLENLLESTSKSIRNQALCIWRREWDSNPR